MARSKNSAISVPLFPFLAVLVCTMGSLILLLLAICQKTSDAYAVPAQLAINPPGISLGAAQDVDLGSPVIPEPPPAPIEYPPGTKLGTVAEREAIEARQMEVQQEWERKKLVLSEERERYSQDVQKQQLMSKAAAQRANSLTLEIQAAQVELGELVAEYQSLVAGTGVEPERKKIDAEIARIRQKLRALEQASASGKSRYMVVPFEPKTGTSRRPILIECTSTGLRFLPENVVVTAQDLEGFTPKTNPLLAGSKALVSYWALWGQQQSNPAEEPQPYVLLLVRPSGTVAYYVAMKMLGSMREPFGYELIDDKTELQLPQLDPGAQRACRSAVEQVLSEQQRVMEATAPERNGTEFNPNTGQRSASNRSAGSGNSSSKTFDMESTKRLFPDANPRIGENSSQRTGGNSWENVDQFEGQENRRPGDSSGSKKPTANGTTSSRPTTSPPTNARGTERATGNGPEKNSIRTPLPDQEELPSPSTANSRKKTASPVDDFLPPPPGPSEASESDLPPPPALESELPGPDSTSDSGLGKRGMPNSPDRQTSSRKSPVPPPSPAEMDDFDDEELDDIDDEKLPLKPTRPPSVGNRGPSGPPPQGTPGHGAHGHGSHGRGGTGNSPIGKMGEMPMENLQHRRWGDSDPRATIGFEHDVQVEVRGDRLVVDGITEIPIRADETRNELILRLLDVIDRRSQTWGRSPTGFYWIPRVKFQVAPGGMQNYERIYPTLNRAGIATKLDGDSKPGAKGTR